MAEPLKARGAKSRANLKRGGAKGGDTRPTEKDKEVRRLSRALLTDPQYRKRLIARLRDGAIQPGVEAMLWYYAYGKPLETVETKQIVPVRIEHKYSE